MTAQVLTREDNGVLRVILARPEKKNALTAAMYESIIAAMDRAARDTNIGALMIEGSGGCFTAGNDIADFIAHATSGATDMAALRFVKAIAACDVPIVAAVDGLAIGVGTTMLFHCDLVYASPASTFRMPFVDLGLVPEAGSSLLVPERVGQARAAELLLLGEPFDAARAQEMGVVNAVIDPAHVLEHALQKAQTLAAKPRKALAATRRLLRGDRSAILTRIDEEAKLFAAAMASDEARVAFMAFLAKGKQ